MSMCAQAIKRRALLKAQQRELRESLVSHIRDYMDAKARGQHNSGIMGSKSRHVRTQLTEMQNTRQTLPEINAAIRFATNAGDAFVEEKADDSFGNEPSGLLKRFTMQAGVLLSHQGTINDLAFNRSETKLASCGAEGIVKVHSHGNCGSFDDR